MSFNFLDKIGLSHFKDKLIGEVPNLGYFCDCSTARNVAAKVIACDGFKLKKGVRIYIRFTSTVTSNPSSGNLTLNINGTGAKNIVDGLSNKQVLTYGNAGWFYNNMVGEFVYDGTYYVWINRDNNTTSTTGTTNKTGTKLYIAGATSQASAPTTYSNSNVYIGTDNELYSGGYKVSHTRSLTTAQYNALTEAAQKNGTLYELTDRSPSAYLPASAIKYNPTGTDLTSFEAQSAITEIALKEQIIRKTLTAGSTSVAFTDDRVGTNSVLSFYASVYGISPKSVSVSGTTVTTTWDAQASNIVVGMRIQ